MKMVSQSLKLKKEVVNFTPDFLQNKEFINI